MKALSASLALAAAGILVLGVASPASAAGTAIDPGDSLYSVGCDDSWNEWQLFSVESTTAFSTKVGEGSGAPTPFYACAGQPAYDFSAGKSYYIQWLYDGDTFHTSLASIDTATGASTTINDFVWVDGEFPTIIDVDSIAIGPNSEAFAFSDGTLYSLDLLSAALTPVDVSLVNIYAFAYDQKSGEYWAIDEDGGIFTVDVTDGTSTYFATLSFDNFDGVYSLQFDEAGTFWIQADEDSEGGSGLWSFTQATVSTPVYSGSFTDDPYYTEALLIIPGKAALAATGADLSTAPLVAGGAALLALAGAGLLIARRRRTA